MTVKWGGRGPGHTSRITFPGEFAGGGEPEAPAATAPVLTLTSAAGTNPPSWSSQYSDVIVGSDYLCCRWRVDGGTWTDETNVLIDSDFVLDYGVDGASYPWPLFSAATFNDGELVEVHEGILRDAVTAWSNTISDTMDAAIWEPSILFDAAQFGFALDPQQFTYQDTAEATPATADTNPVRRIRDISGRNNHFQSLSDSARPLLGVGAAMSGAERFLDLDGSNDLIVTEAGGLYGSGSGTTTIIMAVKSDNTAQVSAYILSEGHSSAATQFYLPGTAIGALATNRRIFIRNNAGLDIIDNSAATGFAFNGNWNVLHIVDNGTSVALKVYSGGALISSATVAYTHSGTFTGNRVGIGALVRGPTPSNYQNSKVGRVIAIRKALSAPEEAEALAWVAENNGIVLP